VKQKTITHRINQVLALASLSSCKRRGVAALAVTPDNITISESYNGWIRHSTNSTCGFNGECSRDLLNIPSGVQNEIGCIHAEENLIINAARTNNSLLNTIVFITTYPCLSCAKLLVQAGVSKIYTIENSYNNKDGLKFLKDMNIELIICKPPFNLITGPDKPELKFYDN